MIGNCFLSVSCRRRMRTATILRRRVLGWFPHLRKVGDFVLFCFSFATFVGWANEISVCYLPSWSERPYLAFFLLAWKCNCEALFVLSALHLVRANTEHSKNRGKQNKTQKKHNAGFIMKSSPIFSTPASLALCQQSAHVEIFLSFSFIFSRVSSELPRSLNFLIWRKTDFFLTALPFRVRSFLTGDVASYLGLQLHIQACSHLWAGF
jgi:hypothetical protein